jgi:hypothetical protein
MCEQDVTYLYAQPAQRSMLLLRMQIRKTSRFDAGRIAAGRRAESSPTPSATASSEESAPAEGGRETRLLMVTARWARPRILGKLVSPKFATLPSSSGTIVLSCISLDRRHTTDRRAKPSLAG